LLFFQDAARELACSEDCDCLYLTLFFKDNNQKRDQYFWWCNDKIELFGVNDSAVLNDDTITCFQYEFSFTHDYYLDIPFLATADSNGLIEVTLPLVFTIDANKHQASKSKGLSQDEFYDAVMGSDLDFYINNLYISNQMAMQQFNVSGSIHMSESESKVVKPADNIKLDRSIIDLSDLDVYCDPIRISY